MKRDQDWHSKVKTTSGFRSVAALSPIQTALMDIEMFETNTRFDTTLYFVSGSDLHFLYGIYTE